MPSLQVVPRITFHLGAYTHPGYAYPILQLKHPHIITARFFERTAYSTVTVYDYADFIVEQAMQESTPLLHIGHSAGAVALWLAGAQLATRGESQRIAGMILMHPANIGSGDTRLWQRPKNIYSTFTELSYFTQQVVDALADGQNTVRNKVKKAYKKAAKPVPKIRFRQESWSLIMSALDGSANADSDFPRDQVLVLKGLKDRVTTPAMVDETIANLGPGVRVLEKKLDHSTPLKDLKGTMLTACLKPLGYKLPD